jgi:methyl-accepting chemotaxis protein
MAKTSTEMVERIAERINEETSAAWRIHNTLAFMAEAVSDDAAGELPVRCTLINLRDDMNQFLENLMDLVQGVKNG